MNGKVGPIYREYGTQVVEGDPIVVYSEISHDARVIHVDGRPHPPSSVRSSRNAVESWIPNRYSSVSAS